MAFFCAGGSISKSKEDPVHQLAFELEADESRLGFPMKISGFLWFDHQKGGVKQHKK